LPKPLMLDLPNVSAVAVNQQYDLFSGIHLRVGVERGPYLPKCDPNHLFVGKMEKRIIREPNPLCIMGTVLKFIVKKAKNTALTTNTKFLIRFKP